MDAGRCVWCEAPVGTGDAATLRQCDDCWADYRALGQQYGIPVESLTGRRFLLKVDLGGPVPAHDPTLGPCHPWRGATNDRGYGVFRVGPDRLEYAHRWVYEAAVGEIPPGWEPDHVCHDPYTCKLLEDCPHRRCVNLTHLHLVTSAENTRRTLGPPALNAAKTHCLRGHPLAGANLYRHPTRGSRHCRACQALHSARHEARLKALRANVVPLRRGRVEGAAQGRDVAGLPAR